MPSPRCCSWLHSCCTLSSSPMIQQPMQSSSASLHFRSSSMPRLPLRTSASEEPFPHFAFIAPEAPRPSKGSAYGFTLGLGTTCTAARAAIAAIAALSIWSKHSEARSQSLHSNVKECNRKSLINGDWEQEWTMLWRRKKCVTWQEKAKPRLRSRSPSTTTRSTTVWLRFEWYCYILR